MGDKKYANPPIAEVICEFFLDQDWDWVTPRQLYDLVKDDFQEKKEVRVKEFDLSFNPNLRKCLRTDWIDYNFGLKTNQRSYKSVQIE